MKIKVVLALILSLELICSVFSFAFAEENIKSEPAASEKPSDVNAVNENSIEEEIENKWTETLKLKDYYLLPDYLEVRDRFKDYAATIAKNYEETPDVFSSAVVHGLILIDRGEISRARKVWEKAVEDFAGNPTPKVYKAWVDALEGNYLLAKDAWYPVAKEKIELGITGSMSGIWLPYHTDSILGLYLIKDNLPEKDKLEVENVIDEIAKHFARNPKIASILITKDYKAGKIKSAAEKLAVVLERYPEEPELITLLGIGQLLSRHYEDALNLFDNSNKIFPNSPTTHLMKARVLFALNKKKESESEYEKALKIEPGLQDPENYKSNKLLAEKSYIVKPAKADTKRKKDEFHKS